MREFEIPNGMARSVFENKYGRKKEDGTYQTWVERVTEVVRGNFSLLNKWEGAPRCLRPHLGDYERTLELAKAGVFLTSGRHLQHGDLNQPERVGEYHTNCSTAMFSFIKFWLLLKGSGVGRCYDGDLCRVNWDNMPNVRFVLEGPDPQTGTGGHPDYQDWIETRQEAEHKYPTESEDVRWFSVGDSAEGWVKVVEILETAAWQEKHREKLFIFDFTPVRSEGTPISGQQGRPASGPVPFIRALCNIARLKGSGMQPWKQAMFIDHYLATCVAIGGIRRAARIAVKSWRDKDVFEFIDIKRGGWLWSANNSVAVDEDFWEKSATPAPSHARRVFEAMCSAAYFDNTGEPGFLNVDKMVWDDEGVENITADKLFGERGVNLLKLHKRTFEMLDALLDYAKNKKYPFLVNPCVTLDTWILTDAGPKQVRDLRDAPFQAIVDGESYSSTAFFKTGTKEVLKIRTTRGYELRLTGNHKVKVSHGDGEFEWVEVDDLLPGDSLVIGNHRELKEWTGEGSFDEGWLVGGVVASAALRDLCSRYLSMEGKTLLSSLESTSSEFHRGFLRGFFDADGSVQGNTQKGLSVRLSQSEDRLKVAQRMLARLGIASTIYLNRKAQHELVVSRDNLDRFAQMVGFDTPEKEGHLRALLSERVRRPYKESWTAQVLSIEVDGVEDVYDCTVDSAHEFDANGLQIHNCGEIVLAVWGGYCTIGDVCLANAETLQDALDAVSLMAKFLVRTNTMDFLYQAEVTRTNRIGVGLTGIHEFAYTHFGFDFWDLIDEGKSAPFWAFLAKMRDHAISEVTAYCRDHGLKTPHTALTLKPSGTVSKLMQCTEGAHLPAYGYYMRWVQYAASAPEVAEHTTRGYPVKDISSMYPGMVVIGFPTKMPIADLMGEDVVVASQANPEQQYQWLRLLETHWLGATHGNQVSYTLKYDPNDVTYEDFMGTIHRNQRTVRCCSVMPQVDTSAYIYTPEELLSPEEYEEAVAHLERFEKEGYDSDQLACEGGACPIEPDRFE